MKIFGTITALVSTCINLFAASTVTPEALPPIEAVASVGNPSELTGAAVHLEAAHVGSTSDNYNSFIHSIAGGYGGAPTKGSFSLRGWSQDSFFGGIVTGTNNIIGVESYGIPQTSFSLRFLPPSLWDVDTVNIKYGSQTLHSGANYIGGLLEFNTVKPQFFNKSLIKLEYGERDTQRIAATQNLNLIENKLALRLNYERESTDGSVNNITLNDPDSGSYRAQRSRAQLLWHPDGVPNTELLLHLEYNTMRGNIYQISSEGTGFSLFDRVNEENTATSIPADQWQGGIKFYRELSPELTYHQNTAIHSFSHDQSGDLDMGGLLDWTVLIDHNERKFFHSSYLTHEGDSVDWKVGIYFARGDTDLNFDGVGLVGIEGIPFTSLASEKSYTFANFYEMKKKLNDNLHLHGGFRVQYDRQEFENSSTITSISSSKKQDDFTFLPQVGVTFSPSNEQLYGFKIARGYRAGGVSHAPLLGSSQPYDPEYSIDTELFTEQQIGGTLQLRSSLYYTDLTDQQVAVTVEGGAPGIDQAILNSGKSRRYGADIQLRWNPSPNWYFQGNLSYTNSKFTSLDVNGTNRDGQALPLAPRWITSVAARYEPEYGVFGSAHFHWSDETYDRVNEPVLTALESRTLLHFKIGWKQQNWRVYGFVENTLNDNFAYSRNRFSSLNNSVQGKVSEPRLYGVGCEMHF